MDKIIKYAGIIITVLTLLGGAVTGYSKLQGKVDVLKEKADEIKLVNLEQDKRLSENEKAMAKTEANQQMIMLMLEKIEKKL